MGLLTLLQRVDSDLDGRGNRHGAATGGILGTAGSHATPGSGTTQNTAGYILPPSTMTIHS